MGCKQNAELNRSEGGHLSLMGGALGCMRGARLIPVAVTGAGSRGDNSAMDGRATCMAEGPCSRKA